MQNVILILGPNTESIHRIIDVHHKNSLTVEASFRTVSEFHSVYYQKVMNVERIVVLESAFSANYYDELTKLKEVLQTFYANFKEIFILTSTSPDVLELTEMFKTDLGEKGNLVKVYDNERYNPRMILSYCKGNITRRHFVKSETQFEPIVRYRKGKENTFEVETENEDTEDTEVIVVDSKKSATREFEEKKRSILSVANSSTDLTWEGSPIIKDIARISELHDLAGKVKKYNIDYSSYHLSSSVKSLSENLIVVTGEKRTGKSTMALAIAKSATSSGKKVLLIDSDLKSLGLSDLLERSGILVAPMLLQDFIRFSDSLKTIVKTTRKLNAVVLNSDTKKELNGVNHLTLINMIASCAMKYYDLVVVDLSLDDIESCKPLFKVCEKTVITISNSVSSVLSAYKSMNGSNLFKLVEDRMTFIPNNMFRSIDGISIDSFKDIRESIRYLFGSEVNCIKAVTVEGLELEEHLYRAIKSK